MIKTMVPPKSLKVQVEAAGPSHSEALAALESLRVKLAAATDQAEAELREAQAEYDRWYSPAAHLAKAQAAYRNAIVGGDRNLSGAQARVVNAAAPCLKAEIDRLSREVMTAGLLFRSWGNSQSNRVEVEAYSAGCRDAINKLQAFQFQQHDEISAREFIADLRRSAPPRPAPEYS